MIPISINIHISSHRSGQRTRPSFICWGKGAFVFYKHLHFLLICYQRYPALALTLSAFLNQQNGICRHMTGNKYSRSSTKFVGFFSAPEPKAQVHYCYHALSVIRPSLTFHIFDFSSETTKQNSFRINETWQEARNQHPLPSLCFSGRSEKQDDRPGLWLAETFLTSPLKPQNGIQRNLTGSKISTSSTKLCFQSDEYIKIKCSWHRTCIKVFWPDLPKGGSRAGQK